MSRRFLAAPRIVDSPHVSCSALSSSRFLLAVSLHQSLVAPSADRALRPGFSIPGSQVVLRESAIAAAALVVGGDERRPRGWAPGNGDGLPFDLRSGPRRPSAAGRFSFRGSSMKPALDFNKELVCRNGRGHGRSRSGCGCSGDRSSSSRWRRRQGNGFSRPGSGGFSGRSASFPRRLRRSDGGSRSGCHCLP